MTPQLRPIPTRPATYTYQLFGHLRPIPTGIPVSCDLYLPEGLWGSEKNLLVRKGEEGSCDLYLLESATYTYHSPANMAKTSLTSVGNSADSREPLLRRESIEIAA